MRREELYLTDMIDAADAIQRFMEGVERQDFFSEYDLPLAEISPRKQSSESAREKTIQHGHPGTLHTG